MITSDFAAYAVGVDAHFDPPISGKELQGRVERLMARIAQECTREGATLIGHIKCVVETTGSGFLQVSVTEPSGRPMARGDLADHVPEMELIVNVLLYGLTRSKVKSIVDPLAMSELQVSGAELGIEDLEKGHDHDHEHHEHPHEHC